MKATKLLPEIVVSLPVARGAVTHLTLGSVEALARFDVRTAVLTMILIKHLGANLNVCREGGDDGQDR